MAVLLNKNIGFLMGKGFLYIPAIRLIPKGSLLLFIFFLFIQNSYTFSQPYGNEWIDYKKTYYKFPVREQRFYRIPSSTLAASGLSDVPVEHFQLWRDGVEVPLYTTVANGPLPLSGYIEFFGKPNSGIHETPLFEPGWHYHPERSMFSDTAYYFLTVNATTANLRFTLTANAVSVTNILPDSFYMATANPLASANSHYVGNAILVEGTSFRSANWDIGEGFVSGRFDFTRTLQFNLTGLRAFLNGPQMRIHYTPFGVRNYTRDVILRMNDVEIDRLNIAGINGKDRVLENIPAKGNIINDAINFKFNSSFFDETDFEQNVLGRFLLTYPRQFFHNSHSPVEINLPANSQGNHIRLQGLPNGNVAPVLYDLTNLKLYVGVIKPDSSLFALEPSTLPRSIVIGTQVANQLRTVTTLAPVQFRDFALPTNQGNYLIISNQILRQGPIDAVESYRAYRASVSGGNYHAKIYDINEIADQFCFGVRKNPMGIRRFLLYAADHFAIKPKMAFLMGRGSNYAGVFRSGANINRELLNSVPTWGTPSSDNLLASRNLKIPVPEMPIGRLSAVYPQEILDYLEKVKEFETLQRTRPMLPSENEWRKKVLHLIGGDDEFTATLLGLRMNQNAQFLRVPKIGAAVSQFSRIDSLAFAKNAKEVEDKLNSGVGLLTYFGHSSASSIDFNLGSPNLFNNPPGRYPVFIANGCRAGNIFDFNTSRLVAQEVSISENFIFAPRRGSITFISSSDLGLINYQNLMTREWYQSYNNSQFGKTIGEIQKEASYKAWLRTSLVSDRLNNFNVEQTILHGDPGIVPFPATLPDFAVESKFINLKPEQVITELDSVEINLHCFNLGAAVNGQVMVQLDRELPDGSVKTILSRNLQNLFHTENLRVKIGLKGLFEEGNGYLIARIDPGGSFQEMDKDNNVAILPFNLDRNHIIPVFPYNYSIVNKPELSLKASTTNPTDMDLLYTFQVDTTALFNSSFLLTKDTLSKSGLVQWKPQLNLLPETVYYWRVIKTGAFVPESAKVFSFVYKPGSQEGFSQSHFFQHRNSTTEQIQLNEDRNWNFANRSVNLYVAHGIYLNSGFEDVHFAINVNGQRIIYSACLGKSIVFNLFDPVTFSPIRNSGTGDYGSAGVCGPGKEFNFEFRYFPHTSRKVMMDFIDSIPKGTLVTARLVVDPPVDSSFVSFWKNDTLFYGAGNSLYHKLVEQGFYNLDSLNRHRTFFFMFQKGDSSQFKPIAQFSRGNRDRVHASVFPTHTDKSGSVTSPWIGPANKWIEANWQAAFKNEQDSANTKVSVSLWGKKNNQERVKIGTWEKLEDRVDIKSIDAEEFPNIQFEMNAVGDQFGYAPPQLNHWGLNFEPIPDGAWSPADHFNILKNTLKPLDDTLALQMAFKNISGTSLPPTLAKVYITDFSGNSHLVFQQHFKALSPDDTAILNINQSISLPQGLYQLRAEVNEAGNPKEQTYINNRFLLPLVVDGGVLPIWILRFNALKVGSKVALNWEANRDNNIEGYQVEHSIENGPFKIIADNVRFDEFQNGFETFRLIHTNPENGQNLYRLKIHYKDGSIKYSEIRKILFETISGVKMVPNPFQHSFIVQPLENNTAWQIRVVDAGGKLIHAENGMGFKRINMGRFADGLYWIEWSSGNKHEVFKLLKQK